MAITTQSFFDQYTKALVDVYKERPVTTSFLRSFFTEKVVPTKHVSIEVSRGTEKAAVDVIRKSEGNRNTFSLSNEKIFEPPYYREYFDVTDLDIYERAIGSTDPAVIQELLYQGGEKLAMLQDKIDRAIELQCAQALTSGIVTVDKGTNIDYGRKAGLVENLSASPWSNNANNPYTTLQGGIQDLRKTGKAFGSMFNVIMGADAFGAFLGNTNVTGRADIRNYNLDAIRTPQRNSVGGDLHGVVSAGSYTCAIWTYDQYYDVAGTPTPYLDPKKIIILPENPRFTLAFAQVPKLRSEGVGAQKYLVSNYVDERNSSEIIDIKSAPLAILTAVDQVYTAQVLA